MSNHCRAVYEFKTVIAKKRRYRYWYLRVPAGRHWRSVYIGHKKPLEPAAALAKRFRDLGPESLNRLLRKRRAIAALEL